MASSRKLKSADLTKRVAALIAPLLPERSSILIGLSGGVDSVLLLHLLHKFAPRYSWQLSALHVHHGISPNADAWANFCADLCARQHIPLHIEHVDIAPLRAQGLEAAARQLRHAAFAAQSCDFVALAHHADDQAETLLLQLLRGAGVKGASAMALLSCKDSSRVVRPLLHTTRAPGGSGSYFTGRRSRVAIRYSVPARSPPRRARRSQWRKTVTGSWRVGALAASPVSCCQFGSPMRMNAAQYFGCANGFASFAGHLRSAATFRSTFLPRVPRATPLLIFAVSVSASSPERLRSQRFASSSAAALPIGFARPSRLPSRFS